MELGILWRMRVAKTARTRDICILLALGDFCVIGCRAERCLVVISWIFQNPPPLRTDGLGRMPVCQAETITRSVGRLDRVRPIDVSPIIPRVETKSWRVHQMPT